VKRLEHDEAPGRHQGQSSSNSSSAHSTRQLGQAPIWHAIAKAELVTARTGCAGEEAA